MPVEGAPRGIPKDPVGAHDEDHAARHASGGADAVKLDDLAAPDDNTDLNASTSAHGLLPKLPGGSTNFLREDGAWSSPGAASVPAVISAAGKMYAATHFR